MKKTFFAFCIALGFIQCSSDSAEIFYCGAAPCDTPAVIRDLTGLDGCRFVLELNDGTRLEPVLTEVNTPPGELEWVDGKSVVISYEVLTDLGSYCMVGQPVKITCIIEAFDTSEE
jgi:hypothetical protein